MLVKSFQETPWSHRLDSRNALCRPSSHRFSPSLLPPASRSVPCLTMAAPSLGPSSPPRTPPSLCPLKRILTPHTARSSSSSSPKYVLPPTLSARLLAKPAVPTRRSVKSPRLPSPARFPSSPSRPPTSPPPSPLVLASPPVWPMQSTRPTRREQRT